MSNRLLRKFTSRKKKRRLSTQVDGGTRSKLNRPESGAASIGRPVHTQNIRAIPSRPRPTRPSTANRAMTSKHAAAPAGLRPPNRSISPAMRPSTCSVPNPKAVPTRLGVMAGGALVGSRLRSRQLQRHKTTVNNLIDKSRLLQKQTEAFATDRRRAPAVAHSKSRDVEVAKPDPATSPSTIKAPSDARRARSSQRQNERVSVLKARIAPKKQSEGPKKNAKTSVSVAYCALCYVSTSLCTDFFINDSVSFVLLRFCCGCFRSRLLATILCDSI